jgi:hypothetical protein
MVATSAAVAPAAVVATSATATNVAASTMAAASAAMTAATAMANKLYIRGCSVAFFVEDVESRQANVWDFFLTERDLIAFRLRQINSTGDCRGSARERQRQSSGPQHREGFAPALSLWNLFWLGHRCNLLNFMAEPRSFAEVPSQ